MGFKNSFSIFLSRKWWRTTTWYATWMHARRWATPLPSAPIRLAPWPPTAWPWCRSTWETSTSARSLIPTRSTPTPWKRWSAALRSTVPIPPKSWWAARSHYKARRSIALLHIIFLFVHQLLFSLFSSWSWNEKKSFCFEVLKFYSFIKKTIYFPLLLDISEEIFGKDEYSSIQHGIDSLHKKNHPQWTPQFSRNYHTPKPATNITPAGVMVLLE